ncbi:MAG: hypothetical protein JXR84_01460 [Anaerolineae bacterium]|nr:hypothetical protein [Anaerolineae bacterium]
MIADRTSKSIQAYNIFKFVVTLILILIIVILLLRARTGVAPTRQGALPTVSVTSPTLSTPKVSDDGMVTLSGTGTSGSTIEIWSGSKRVGEATVGADGMWSFATPLDAGNYDFTARAVDASGKTLAESEALEVTVPVLVETPVLSAPQVGDDGTVTLPGTGTPGSTIEIWAGGKLLGETTVGADGKWSFAGPLETGDYDFTARAVDASGKTLAESAPLKFTVLVLDAPTFNLPQVGDDGTVMFSGTGTPGSTVEVWTDGALLGETPVEADGTWSFDVLLDPGDYECTARAVHDASGATSAESEPSEFTVPALIKAPTLSMPEVNDDWTVTFSGTGEPGTIVEVWGNTERIGQATVGEDGTWLYNTLLAPAPYYLLARAVDDSGALLGESERVAFEMGRRPLLLVEPQNGAVVAGDSLSIKGTGHPNGRIEITDHGKIIGVAEVQADGTWSFDYACEPGTYVIAAQNAGDAANATEAVNVEVAAAFEPEPEPEPAAGVCTPGNIPMGVDQGTTYIVARCEYMGLIAQRAGVKLVDLIVVNPQVTDINLIYPGQVLNLPPR